MKTTGFAIVTDGVIDVRTVSPSKIGAMVNWLYSEGVRPLDWWSDEQVEEVFNLQPKGQTFCRAVSIEVDYE
jgi:hypothetical protein